MSQYQCPKCCRAKHRTGLNASVRTGWLKVHKCIEAIISEVLQLYRYGDNSAPITGFLCTSSHDAVGTYSCALCQVPYMNRRVMQHTSRTPWLRAGSHWRSDRALTNKSCRVLLKYSAALPCVEFSRNLVHAPLTRRVPVTFRGLRLLLDNLQNVFPVQPFR